MGKLNVVVFSTPEEKAKGLQHMEKIPAATLFVFPDTPPGTVFHSQNVAEPFDVAFVSLSGEVLEVVTLVPPRAVVVAPAETATAIEAQEGFFEKLKIEPGRRFNMVALLGPRKLPKTGENEDASKP